VSPKKRLKMINKMGNISLLLQCKILKISRSSLYYTPVGFNSETLELMRQIDKSFTQHPFFGSRQIAAYLPRKGYHAGRHRVRRLMKVMGLEAIYKRPNTSKKHPETGFIRICSETCRSHVQTKYGVLTSAIFQ